jgi:transcriptional regulator with XRE-family HTH domain
MSVQNLKKELFKDKSFKKYFKQNKSSYEIAVSVMEARISRGLSQAALAKKVGTKQPSIARLEKGSYLPSLGFLEKIAEALGTELILPKFKFLESEKSPIPVNIVWKFDGNSYEEKFETKERSKTSILELINLIN